MILCQSCWHRFSTVIRPICLLTLFLTCTGVKAQVSSSALNGTVRDSAGAVVPKAGVTVTSTATGFTRSVTSSDAGQYAVPDLAPGLYEVSAEAPGFKKAVLSGVRLFVGQTATADIRLEVGQLTESVTVQSEVPLLQESTSHVGTVIEGKLLTDIPLNGRNFLQLNLLSPGVTRSKSSNTFDAVQINPTAQSFNVNGQKGDYNLYLLDGAVERHANLPGGPADQPD